MRYGLRSNSHSKQKWKISVENEIATLKAEVCTLKQQLRSSVDMMNLLLSKKPDEASKKDFRECTTFKKDENVNATSNDWWKWPNVKIKAPVGFQRDLSAFNKSNSSPFHLHQNPFEPSFSEVKKSQDILNVSHYPKLTARYKATLNRESEGNERLSSITAMPEYINFSVEELRAAFYRAAYPKENQLFYDDGLKDVLTGTLFVKYSPVWDFDQVTRRPVRLECITVQPSCQNKSLEELRLEDYILKEITPSNQSAPVENDALEKPIEMSFDSKSLQRQEELLTEITSQLGRMDINLTSVNSQLSIMDANLLEIKSQMSVMDSRLSAVDMFTTMQRVDKKWQGLRSRLQTLENSPDNIDSHAEKKINVNYDPIQNLKLSIQELKRNSSKEQFCLINKTSVESEEDLKLLPKNECKVQNLCGLSQNIIFICTEDTISICQLPTNSDLCLVDKSAKVLNIASDIEDYLKETQHKGRKTVNDQLPDTSSTEKPLNLMPHDVDRDSSLQNNSNAIAKNDSTATDLLPKVDSGVANNSNIKTFENECDQEDCGFVIVDESHIKGNQDTRSKEANSFNYSSDSSNYKICGDITEYLEVNLGKRKDLVYEFGFEAKPDISVIDLTLDSSASYDCTSQDTSQASSSISSKKDDSFLLPIDNDVETGYMHCPQSTPVSVNQIFDNKLEH